jgi:hypothetical protein
MEKCSRSVWFWLGESVGPFPVSPQPTVRVSWCFKRHPLRRSTRGGFLPASSGRYAVHCLAEPNYTISTIANTRNLVAFITISGQFGYVYHRSSFSGVLLLRHGSCWEHPLTYFFATPVTRSPDHIKIPRASHRSCVPQKQARSPSQCRTTPPQETRIDLSQMSNAYR